MDKYLGTEHVVYHIKYLTLVYTIYLSKVKSKKQTYTIKKQSLWIYAKLKKKHWKQAFKVTLNTIRQ